MNSVTRGNSSSIENKNKIYSDLIYLRLSLSDSKSDTLFKNFVSIIKENPDIVGMDYPSGFNKNTFFQDLSYLYNKKDLDVLKQIFEIKNDLINNLMIEWALRKVIQNHMTRDISFQDEQDLINIFLPSKDMHIFNDAQDISNQGYLSLMQQFPNVDWPELLQHIGGPCYHNLNYFSHLQICL